MVNHSRRPGNGDGTPVDTAGPTTPSTLLDWAFSYADRGWCIIPVRKKKAAGRWKQFQANRPDPATLRRLFGRGCIDGLAVLLGPASGGLVCRDYDDLTSYQSWAATHRDLADALPTVETARGRHVYFRGPPGFADLGDGEYRGDAGHYVVLPPSRHPSGHVYRWVIPLPADPLPLLDPIRAGLLPRGETERTEKDREERRKLRKTEEVNDATRGERNGEPLADSPGRRTAPSEPTPTLGQNVGGQANLLQHSGVQEAIAATLPRRGGERNKKLFQLARHLKALPVLAGLPARVLRPIVVEWHRRALPFISTKGFADTWADFVLQWPKVRFPVGEGAVDAAFERACQAEPPAAAVALYGGDGRLLLLASLCRELQRSAGDGPFFLDCRTAGRLLTVPHTTAWRWLVVLCADEIVEVVETGGQAAGNAGKASRYRYLAD